MRGKYKKYIFIVSKCGEHDAETVVAVSIAVVVIEREHSSIGSVIVVATAIKERFARKRKVRVVSLFPIKLNIYILFNFTEFQKM